MSFFIEKYAFRPDCCTRTKHLNDAGKPTTVTVHGPCYMCHVPQSVTADAAGFAKFEAGDYVQDCLPELSADEREFLLSGICPTCWAGMFPPYEDEE